VLITSGGTIEPIDGVRVIANTSTGRTGRLIADVFIRHGHDVVFLRARNAPAADGARDETFGTFDELDGALQRLLAAEPFDAVIHAAAVSDFSIDRIEVGGRVRPRDAGKLSSDAEPVLYLRRNHKLLDTLRARSRNPAIRIVAFKLTQNADAADVEAEVGRYFESGVADIVVHNDTSRREANGVFPATIWDRHEARVEVCADRDELAAKLEARLSRAQAGPLPPA
jgi:phosphopantothenoylcysteine decarboxylase/phosphopantothenate--cysteine ligase